MSNKNDITIINTDIPGIDKKTYKQSWRDLIYLLKGNASCKHII